MTRPDRSTGGALARAVDAALEATVVASFSRVGFRCRRRLGGWCPPARLDGAVAVVTGASSGIGRAVAEGLGGLGAEVWAVGRDPARTEAAAAAVRAAGGDGRAEILDVVEPAAVDAFVARLGRRHDHLDVLVHGAGALFRERRTAPDGTELTVATHVLAPYRLSARLAPLLARRQGPHHPTIVTVSSGGMYTARLDVDRLAADADGATGSYDGVRTYARAKRAEVALSHEWATRWGGHGIASVAMHPGWVDTPGLASALPTFARLGPLLRRPDEGADTAVWLAAGGDGRRATAPTEGFWLDRRRRGEHHLPWTRPRRGEDGGARLWDWCASRTGLDGRIAAGAT